MDKYCTGSKPKAKFLTIYIDEGDTLLCTHDVFPNIYASIIFSAHAVDGWYMPMPIGKVPIYNHKTLQDRIAAATQLKYEHDFPGELVVDSMENEAMNRYKAHPERVFIVQDGFIVYHGGPGPFEYKLGEVEDWLRKRDLDGSGVTDRLQQEFISKLGAIGPMAAENIR